MKVILALIAAACMLACWLLTPHARGRQDLLALLWERGGTMRLATVGQMHGRPFASFGSDLHAGPGQPTMAMRLRGSDSESLAVGFGGLIPAVYRDGGFGGADVHRFGFTLDYDEPTAAGRPGPAVRLGTRAYAALPAWLLFLPMLLAPIAVAPAWRRRRRWTGGLCLACGYDLRGLPPDRERCPECGEPPFNNTASRRSARP